MASPLLSTDQQNFIYFGLAAAGEIPRILRILLESKIQPYDLPAAVSRCSSLKLGQEQRCLVCPNSCQVPDYEDFDATLLYTLLRNLCPAFTPTKGWGKTPSPCDINVGDDIERLRNLRNTSYAHLKKASISNAEFQDLWRSLKDICKRMEVQTNNLPVPKKFHNGLDDILNKELKPESFEYYRSILESNGQNVCKKLSEISKTLEVLVSKQQRKTNLRITGPSTVQYGNDAEIYIDYEGEANNNIHSVTWVKKGGAVSHTIDTACEKYRGSSNEKLIIRSVSREDHGKYQAIMSTEFGHLHVDSNEIDLAILGNIPCVTLSGSGSVCFGNTTEICATILSDLSIVEMKWKKIDHNQCNESDLDVKMSKYKGSLLDVQTSKLVINNATFKDTGHYCFAVSNAVGEGRSNIYLLRVTGSLPVITIGHITDLQARSLMIISNVTTDKNSPPVTSIRWSKDGRPMVGIPKKYRFLQERKRRSLCILNVNLKDAGSYKCKAINLVGSSESEIIQIGPPEIFMKDQRENEISTTFSARIISIPSLISVNWSKIITTDHGPQCIPIDINDSVYQGSSNFTSSPKLVVKRTEAVKLQKVKLIAENFIGKSSITISENLLQFYNEGPSKAKFLLLSDSIRESLSDGDLKPLKNCLLCLGSGKDAAEIKELGSLFDLFSFLLSNNYFNSTDVVFMQLLLRRIKCKKLEQMCIKYATEDSRALCYYAESERPVNGHTHVHFHITENIINYPREYAEKIRETIALVVGCPTDCQDCLRLDGIRCTSSFNLVFSMKNEYVTKLLNVNPEKFAVLGRYSVDKIYVGGQTIHIDSSEMCVLVEAESIPSKRKLSDESLEDPRPAKFSKMPGYQDYVRSQLINCCSMTSEDIALRYLFKKTDIQVAAVDHHYTSIPITEYWVDEANKLTEEDITNIEKETRQQASCKQWFIHRSWRLTASRFGELCKLTSRRNITKLCQNLLSVINFLQNRTLAHGKNFESKALKSFELKYDCKARPVGFCICESKPFLGATPDALLYDDRLVEIICPYSGRNEKILPGKHFRFLEYNVTNEIILKEQADTIIKCKGNFTYVKKKFVTLFIHFQRFVC